MSQWMTSGRSRLKARQKNSFAQRAQQRARVVAPEAIRMLPVRQNQDKQQLAIDPVFLRTQQPQDLEFLSGEKAKAKYSINNPIRRRGIVVTARKRQRQMDPSYVMAEATRHSKRRMQSPNMEYFEDSLHSSMSLSPKPRPPFAGKVPVYQRWSRLYQQQVAFDEIPQVPRMKDAELNEFNDIYSMEGKAYTATGFSPSPENLLSPLDVSFRTDAIRFANDTPPPEFSLNNNEFEDINIENDYPRGDLHQEKRFFQGEARRNRGISRFEKQNTGNRISKLRLWNEGIEVGKALI